MLKVASDVITWTLSVHQTSSKHNKGINLLSRMETSKQDERGETRLDVNTASPDNRITHVHRPIPSLTIPTQTFTQPSAPAMQAPSQAISASGGANTPCIRAKARFGGAGRGCCARERECESDCVWPGPGAAGKSNGRFADRYCVNVNGAPKNWSQSSMHYRLVLLTGLQHRWNQVLHHRSIW